MDAEGLGALSDEAFLRQYLAERSVACPMCAYELRGLTSDRCPECGERLVLQVGAAEPKMAAWVAGLIGLAGGAGFNVVLFGWGLLATLVSGFGPELGELIVIFAFAAVGAVALLAWVRLGRRIRRLPRTGRSLVVLGAWGLSLALVVLTFVAIR